MTAHGRKSDGFSSAHHSSAPHSVAANLGCQQLSGVRARPQPTVKGVKRRFLGGGAGLLNVPSAHFSTSFAPPPSTSHCLVARPSGHPPPFQIHLKFPLASSSPSGEIRQYPLYQGHDF